jgi:hypothetical protein
MSDQLVDGLASSEMEPMPFHGQQVEAMAGYGLEEDDIARVLGLDTETLRRVYPEQLSTGRIKANARVAESLFRKATSDGAQSVTAAIFWLKTRARWREAPQEHHVGLCTVVLSEADRNL